MADQADNLRQLVRAHQQWRDLAAPGLSAPVRRARGSRGWFTTFGTGKTLLWGRGANDGGWLARVTRWALGRVI